MDDNAESRNSVTEKHTVSLLKECANGCQMAISGVKQIRKFVTDEKLNDLLEAYGEKHKGFEKETVVQLGKHGATEDSPNKIAEISAWMSVEIGMLTHPDNHEAAKKMMDGCNMGIQSLSKYVNQYEDADEDAKNIAERIIKIEEDLMEEMKQFI